VVAGPKEDDMTQYMLSVIHGELNYSDEEMHRIVAAVDEFNATLRSQGNWVFAGGLEPPTSATTVDGTRAEVVITDGPFAETKEHLGGFWVIEAEDLDAALKIAAAGSKACAVPVEVRPFQSA
jgi:hypothetical protein